MSTRKSIAATTAAASPITVAATTTKTDNVSLKITCPTPEAKSSEEDKPEMGSNVSTTGGEQTETDATGASKDSSKNDTKQMCNEPKRITRNSPLLLASPKSASGVRSDNHCTDGIDSELTNSEGEEGFGTSRRQALIRGRKSLKESKENSEKDKKSIENKELEKCKIIKGTDTMEIKDAQSNKELEANASVTSVLDGLPVQSVDNTPPANNLTPTAVNRLTRKTVAQEIAANTRVTRNRHTSTNRPETPPSTANQTGASTRARRSNSGKKTPFATIEPFVKRKRTDDESTEHSVNKFIKVEPKDDSEVIEEYLPPPVIASSNCNESDIKIKQEIIESDEYVTETVTSNCNAMRGRSRWSVRKSQQANLHSSPSTRATRLSKNASPSPTTSTASSTSGGGPTESKRRRYASSNALTRRSTTTLLKTAATGSANGAQLHVPDEDSKDSMASSSVDEILLPDIKLEKLSTDLTEDTNLEVEIYDKNTVAKASEISLPLNVETELIMKEPVITKDNCEKLSINDEASTSLGITDNRNTSISEGSEKAASLSPEMVSEGVSEISVKQFYKKPEFLENNLGIEEDPKLGEIVQKVTTEKEHSLTNANVEESKITNLPQISKNQSDKKEETVSNDVKDPKHGELLLIENNQDGKKVSVSDDTNSLDTGNFSPLIVEEDDEFAAVEEKKTEAGNIAEDDNISKVDATSEKLEADILEDDITMEESETISMDNNPSINEEVSENVRDELDGEVEEIVQDVKTIANENDKKTKTECDSNEAKLKVNKKDDGGPVAKEAILIENAEDKTCESDQKKIDKEVLKGTQIGETELLDPNSHSELSKPDENNDVRENSESKCYVKSTDNLKLREANELSIEIQSDVEMIEDLKNEKSNDSYISLNTEQREKSEAVPKDQIENLVVGNEINIMKVVDRQEDTKDENVVKKIVSSPQICVAPVEKPVATKKEQLASIKSCTTKGEGLEEDLRQKEQHFQNLGLLTHKAAEKRRQEYIQSSAAAVEASRIQPQPQPNNGGGKRNGKTSCAVPQEYTGTLKTVIKINRNCNGGHTTTTGNSTSSSRKGNSKEAAHNQPATATTGSNINATSSKDISNGNGSTVRRQSLKITFQKGRGRGQGHTDRATDHHNQGEDAYYTIQNENEEAQKAGSSGTFTDNSKTQTHGRKSYNRSNTTSHSTNSATIDISDSESHEVTHFATLSALKQVVIPEKASSFKLHPDRLCEDQCFYCGGKFGLYDTPCHVGQIKFMERQQKILANEEKLTVDSCLCEACFRHVDRRANVPSYKKRLSATAHMEGNTGTGESADGSIEGEEDTKHHKCGAPDCVNPAVHALRRKCIKKSVKKFLLSFGIPPSPCVWLCQTHYDTVMQCSGCVLCKRRLGKNHMYHITSDTDRLEKSLTKMGIPVQLGIGTAVCKLCRYFANLLMKPRDGNKSQKETFLKSYRKRLMQFHNIHNDSNEVSEVEEDDGDGLQQNSTNSNKEQKTPKKSECGELRTNEKNTPPKDLPSPVASTGSSVVCLGETTTLAAEGAEAKQIEKRKKNQKQIAPDNDVLMDYATQMLQSTDSNSSSGPTSPAHDGGSGKQPMSKLKAILQSSSNNSNGTIQSKSNSSTADISTVLRANPNISMRELFPGEEDLGLIFKVPFGSSNSQRTPEGWTRVQTFLQYDEATRRLWEELQKPYGNQSSFLRHLILLEKYYRNGDLVLSPNASSNASVYTQTVRQRLTSYDQGHCGGLVTVKPITDIEKNKNTEIPTVEINEDDEEDQTTSEANNLKETQDYPSEESKSRHNKRLRSISVDKLTKQLSTNAVTIIARPKQQNSDPSPQKSLLKEKSTEIGHVTHNSMSTVTPIPSLCSSNSANSNNTASNSRSILKTNLLSINKSVEILPISSNSASNNNINVSAGKNQNITTETKQQKILEVANKLLGNQLEAVAAAEAQSKTVASALLTSPPELVSLQRRSLGVGGTGVTSAATSTTSSATTSFTSTLINNKKPQMTSKMGTGSSGNVSNHRGNGPPNVVILPESLTQQERQQSKSWRPTLMPVEENQHLLHKGGPLYQTADGRRLPALVQVQSGGKPFLISIFDYNRMCILRREKLLRDQMLKVGKNRHESKQQQPQQNPQLQKGSNPTNLQNVVKNVNKQQMLQQQQQQQHQQQQQQQQQQQTAQQQLIQLQLMQLQKQQQAMKAGRYQHIAPKPTASSHSGISGANSIITSTPGASSTNLYPGPMMPLLANTLPGPSTMGKPGGIGNSSWLWNNFPDANLLLNGGLPQTGTKLPQLLHKPPVLNASNTPATITSGQQPQHMIIDNSLMSKIPKSLTVIPQHKLMNAAAVAASNNVGNMSHKE